MKKNYFRIAVSLALALVMVFALSAVAFADDGFGFTKNLSTSYNCTSGQTYTLDVAASYGTLGAGTDITYTWYINNKVVMTGPSYTFTASSDFSIYCVATGAINGAQCTAITTVCAVKVGSGTTNLPAPDTSSSLSAPTITGQPGSINLSAGQTATLSVSAACPNLGNGISLYYQWFKSNSSNGANATQISGATASSYTPPAAMSGTTYYFVGVKAYNGSAYSSAVYSNVVYISYDGYNGATGSVNNGGALKITKNPTGETVDVGGSATFIARADNAASRVWRIVSKDTTKTVTAKEAAAYFGGLTVSGADTDTLVLSNIPASMHEWSVECKFIAADGKTYLCTNGAIIRVRGASGSSGSTSSSASGSTTGTSSTAKPAATYNPTVSAKPTTSPSASAAPNTGDTSAAIAVPTISTQPVGAVLSEGETTTLAVTATPAAVDGGTQLHYQWYRNDTNSNANGTKIAGAQSATYVPDTISGSKYYYVGVWSSDGTTNSKVIYSSPVAVTYTASLTSPSPSPDADDEDDADSGLKLDIIGPVIAMVLAATAIGVGMFFLLKNASGKNSGNNRRKYYDDDYDDDYRA